MAGRFFTFTAIWIILLATGCATNPADNSASEPEVEEVWWWTPALHTDSCDDLLPTEGIGSSAEKAQRIALEELLEESRTYDCQWVTVSGLFKWEWQYSYAARLYRSADHYYQHHGQYLGESKSFIQIEGFADGRRPAPDIQHVEATVTGLFYDLCFHNELRVLEDPDYEEGQFIWEFGPCHMRPVWLLNEARLDEIHTPSFNYRTDPDSAEKFGDLVPFPTHLGDAGRIAQGAREWLSFIVDGDWEAYAKVMRLDSYVLEEEEKSPSAFRRFYFMFDPSPLAGVSPTGEELEPRVFATTSKDGEEEREIFDDFAVVCFCYDGGCNGKWPILTGDAETPSWPFICVGLNKVDLGAGRSQWAWWYTD